MRNPVPFILGLGGTAALAAALGGCGSNSVAVKGEVTSIDRQCEFKPAVQHSYGETVTGDCDRGNFEAERKNYKNRVANLKGKARVKVSYVSPIDQEHRIGEIVFDGADDEFYALRRGDNILVLMDKGDPTRISAI
jgi:hypothetical protein